MTPDEIYAAAIANGNTPRMAEMFASRKGPGCDTDTAFQSGRKTLQGQFEGDERGRKLIMDSCLKQGFKPSNDMQYEPGLAQFVGDKRAFIQTKGDVRKVCEERGHDASGGATVSGCYREPKTDPNEGRKPLKLVD